MKEKSSRDIILQRINAVKKFDWEVPNEPSSHFFDLFPVPDHPLKHFKDTLEGVGGKVAFVLGNEGAVDQLKSWKEELGWNAIGCGNFEIQKLIHASGLTLNCQDEADVVFTPCEFLISSTGSVLVSSFSGPGRKAHVSPRTHVVFAKASQLKLFIGEAIEALKSKYEEMPSWVALVSGPSRTADIEKTLVMGAHGPSEFIVLVVEEL